MSHTPHLVLPLLAAAQAQKHVTHNEALAALDALVHLAVKERNRTAAPGAPLEGDRYLVGDGAVGEFAGHEGEIAWFDLGMWRFLAPKPGWRAYVEAEDTILVHDGETWRDLAHYSRILNGIERLGIGTDADDLNRLAAKLNVALFTALSEGEGGSGDLRFVLNKAEAGRVLSQLYQTAYGGRAETGLIGDDDFRIRVSADGAEWRDALRVDRATGAVTFPHGIQGQSAFGNLLINGEMSVNQRAYPGGYLAQGYGFDRWKAGSGGCTLVRFADSTIVLTGPVTQVIERPGLAGAQVTVSVEDPTDTITVTVEGVTGTIPAGSGRRGVTLTVPATSTTNVALTLSGEGVSFARPVLNRGPWAEPFVRLPHALNLALCQRYYAKTFPLATQPAYGAGLAGSLVSHAIVSNNIPQVRWQFPVPMRATPLINLYNPSAGNMQWSAGNATASVVAGSGSPESVRIGTASTPIIAPGTLAAIHAVAEAEL